jgi:hypothetical protein
MMPWFVPAPAPANVPVPVPVPAPKQVSAPAPVAASERPAPPTHTVLPARPRTSEDYSFSDQGQSPSKAAPVAAAAAAKPYVPGQLSKEDVRRARILALDPLFKAAAGDNSASPTQAAVSTSAANAPPSSWSLHPPPAAARATAAAVPPAYRGHDPSSTQPSWSLQASPLPTLQGRTPTVTDSDWSSVSSDASRAAHADNHRLDDLSASFQQTHLAQAAHGIMPRANASNDGHYWGNPTQAAHRAPAPSVPAAAAAEDHVRPPIAAHFERMVEAYPLHGPMPGRSASDAPPRWPSQPQSVPRPAPAAAVAAVHASSALVPASEEEDELISRFYDMTEDAMPLEPMEVLTALRANNGDLNALLALYGILR